MHTILRLPHVKARTGRARSSIYADIQRGLFIAPIAIGARAVGWPSGEVDALIAARIAGRSDAEIRALVSKLESARKSSFVPGGR